MIKRRLVQLCAVAMICPSAMAVGCRSRLRVDVDVYTGPLVESEQTRVASAVGIARAMRDIALRASGQAYSEADQGAPAFIVNRNPGMSEQRLVPWRSRGFGDLHFLDDPNADYVAINPPSNERGAHTSLTARVFVNRHASLGQLFAGLAEYYGALEIECRYDEFLARGEPRGPNQQSTVEGDAARRELFARLISFGDACRVVGQQIGVAEIQKHLFVDPRVLSAAVTLDESGRILKNEIDSVNQRQNSLAGVEFSQISSLMASQAPSTVLTAFEQTVPWWNRGLIEKVFNARYWKNINKVEVQGAGTTEYMLIKDEIGNWHLKQAVVDPTKIINAINTASIVAVKIAGAAFGVPIPLSQGGAQAEKGAEQPKADSSTPTPGRPKISKVLQTLLFDVIAVRSKPDAERSKAITDALDKAIEQL